jgi:hypothetical protein
MKIVAPLFALFVLLLPVTLSISMEREQSYPAGDKTRFGESSGMSTAEIVRISAAVAAAELIIPLATADDNSSTVNYQH